MSAFALAACLLAQTGELPGLIERLDDEDPAVRETAAAAIHRMGARAIPDLERALLHPSVEVRGRARDLLGRCGDYALRSILKEPGFPTVRRRWNALIDAVVWKRPIPREVWHELDWIPGPPTSRNYAPNRPLQDGELLRDLQDRASVILHFQARRVGINGLQPELLLHRVVPRVPRRDYLPLVLRADPDPEAFDEVYGTLLSLWFQEFDPGCEGWCEEDWQKAVTLLVHLRRRPGASPLQPPASREEALGLALRGPVLHGIADALGRAFANRQRGSREHSILEIGPGDPGGQGRFAQLRDVYDLLLRLDGQIGHYFYTDCFMEPGKAALPLREVTVPERHRALFDRVRSEPAGEGALRVVREVLQILGKVDYGNGDLEAAAILLRAIGRCVEQAADSR